MYIYLIISFLSLNGDAHKASLKQFIGASVEPRMMIVTELMRGGSLQKYLWSYRPRTLDWKRSISIALDICRVMEYLHANGIIHRDLKPSNQSFLLTYIIDNYEPGLF